MVSISIDYLFNRFYDLLLWLKYTWVFTISRNNVEDYLIAIKYRSYDGLRDRGWFDQYFASKITKTNINVSNYHHSITERLANLFGIKLKDTDGDGIPDVSDISPYDPSNLSDAQIKERFQLDYGYGDKIRDWFGISPKDSDGDTVPNSYEEKHGMNPKDIDSDHDGVIDGVELYKGTDPLNPDTDGDGVLDGRDEAPFDSQISAYGKDTDGDGVSDVIENKLGTDIHKVDTDGDGIPDGMDTFPLDSLNTNYISPINLDNLNKQTEGLHLAIQNPVLHFVSQILSIIAVFTLIFLLIVLIKWFIEFYNALEHYDHHFNHDDENDSHGHKKESHHKKLTYEEFIEEKKEVIYPAGVAGLPIKEEDLIGLEELPQEINNHPKWEVIQGYRISDNEPLWRIGILEADNMLREVLEEKGYEGEDVGAMLMNAKFNTISQAWEAHKVRNKIAHDGSDYTLTEREAKKVYADYEAVFKELKAIN